MCTCTNICADQHARKRACACMPPMCACVLAAYVCMCACAEEDASRDT